MEHIETKSPIRKIQSLGSISTASITVSPSFSKLEQGEYSPQENVSPFEIETRPNNADTVVQPSSPSPSPSPHSHIVMCIIWTGNAAAYFVVCIPYKLLCVVKNNRVEALNYLISIFLHVFLMIVFEIYFYFNYVVVIEKEVFLAKINSYFRDLGRYNHQKYSPQLVALVLKDTTYDALLERLYAAYIISLNAQRELLARLLHQSVNIATIFCIVLLSLVGAGILHCRRIKWRWILAENVMMLGLLGCFEYLFFTTIILKYNPITDAELEYLVVHNMYDYLGANATHTVANMTTTMVPSPQI